MAIGMKRLPFLAAMAAMAAAAFAAPTRGALCLTFDDRNFDAWEKFVPLFEKYGAHATFFVHGAIDERAEKCLGILSKAGHSIGLHGFKHRKVPEALEKMGEEAYLREEIMPQLAVCRAKGLPVRSFAYPCSSHTPQTDALLLRYFDRLRAGWGGNYSPFPMGEAGSRRVLVGLCSTTPDGPDKVVGMLPSLAAGDNVLVAYAHSIESPGQKHDGHNITSADLERILAAAKSAGVAMLGFDELPGSRPVKDDFR